jgi:hypothetical protein
MPGLRRLLQLSRAEYALLFEAALIMILVRVFLRFLSLTRVQQIFSNATSRTTHTCTAHRVPWAIRAVSRTLPGTTCLHQAFAAQYLLVRRGYCPQLTIGVLKDSSNCLQAHAWLTYSGEVLIGSAEMENYTALVSFGGLS